jgi:acetoin utilization protein AcuB
MTADPATILATTTVGEAAHLMTTRGLRHLPVVDGLGRLIGMVSDRDLRGSLAGATSSVPSPSAEVASVMAREVITAQPGDELGTLARVIVERRIGAVPVVDADGRLQGIASYVDVLRRLADDAEADAQAVAKME